MQPSQSYFPVDYRWAEILSSAVAYTEEKVTRLPLAATLTLLLAAVLAPAQQPSVHRPDGAQIPSSQIDTTVTQLMEAAHVTGVGLAIFHNNQIAYLKTYGLRDTEKNSR
jgi:CubicO group peptidase (beta-lactamase class C family)